MQNVHMEQCSAAHACTLPNKTWSHMVMCPFMAPFLRGFQAFRQWVQGQGRGGGGGTGAHIDSCAQYQLACLQKQVRTLVDSNPSLSACSHLRLSIPLCPDSESNSKVSGLPKNFVSGFSKFSSMHCRHTLVACLHTCTADTLSPQHACLTCHLSKAAFHASKSCPSHCAVTDISLSPTCKFTNMLSHYCCCKSPSSS